MLAALANYFAEQNHAVYLYTYEYDAEEQAIDARIKHILCKTHCKVRGVRRFVQIINIRGIIREIQPDVVISFTDYPNLLTLLASIGINTPVIVSERGNPYARSKDRVYKFIASMYQFSEGIVFQTEGARDFFKKTIRDKSVIIPNPVILKNLPDRWSGERKDEIVTAGRFELVTKRQDLILQAIKKVITVHPDIKMVFYGDGDDKLKIEKMVYDLGLAQHVILAGVTNNIFESIRYSKLFVMASDSEGIPNALIEAMSVGMACVSTDCSPGGARLLIENMKNGMIVPRGDANVLADAMIFLLDDEKKREEFGIEAMKITEKFKPAIIYKMWDSYIDEIIARRNLV